MIMPFYATKSLIEYKSTGSDKQTIQSWFLIVTGIISEFDRWHGTSRHLAQKNDQSQMSSDQCTLFFAFK